MATPEGGTNPLPKSTPERTSVFADPPTTGERATRRLLRDITQITADTQNHYDAYDLSKNPRHRDQANASRIDLERTVNALLTMTDVPECLKARVAASIDAATAVLSHLLPLEGEESQKEAVTPSLSCLNLEDAPNSAFRPIVPPHSQPDVQEANGMTLTRDSGTDQGQRDPLASPPLPATPVRRSVVGDSHARPKSRDNLVRLSPNPQRDRERAGSVLSSGSRHEDAAVAIGSARKERLNERQQLRRKKEELEKQRNVMNDALEQMQLDIENAEELEKAKRRDEAADVDEEVRVTLSDASVDQWVADTCARTQPRMQPSVPTHAPVSAPLPQKTQTQIPIFPNPIATTYHPSRVSAAPPMYMHAPTQVTPMRMPYNHVASSHPPAPTHLTNAVPYSRPQMLPTSFIMPPSTPQMPQMSPQAPPLVPQSPQAPPPPSLPQVDSGVGNPGLLQGDVATSLLTVNLRAHSRDLMVQGRPRPEKRFSGGNAQDLESFMTQFEKVTNLEGVTDQMKFSELQHWTSGPASLVVSQYENEQDSTEALTKAKAHLKKEFGRKLATARQMLEQLLVGPKYKESDTAGIQIFILKLNQVHKRAMETKREKSFSTKETFDDILCKKLPFFSRKWSVRFTNSEELIATTQDYSHELTFGQFLEFCRWMNACNSNHRSTFKNDTAATTSTTEPNGKSGKKIAATGVEVAATTTSKPKTNKRPSFPAKKAPANATNGQYNQASVAKPGGQGTKPKPAPTVSQGTAPAAAAKSCLACNTGSHALDSCREFLKMSDEDRRSFVKKRGICYLCLQHGHLASACTCDISCKECSRRHNTVFHRERKPETEES